MKKIIKVGFSTGCFFQWNKEMNDIVNIIKSSGANAIELSFLDEKKLFSFDPDDELIENIHNFDFVSMHVPDKKYIKNTEEKIIEKLKRVSEALLFIQTVKGGIF